MNKQSNYLIINRYCRNYDQGKDALIDYKTYEKKQSIKNRFINHTAIIALRGKVLYSYGMYTNIEIKAGEVFLVPLGMEVELVMQEETELLRIGLTDNNRLCDIHSIADLCAKNAQKEPTTPQHLQMENMLQCFVNQQKEYYLTGLRCYYFHEIKVREFLYILRAYYTKKDLSSFFFPIVNGDKAFSSLVFQAATDAKSVSELASNVGYSLSGFNKKFKRVFDVPPYKWLQDMRAKRLYKKIIRTNRPFKELHQSEGFSSLSEFTRFCKNYYGKTPSELRNKYQGINKPEKGRN